MSKTNKLKGKRLKKARTTEKVKFEIENVIEEFIINRRAEGRSPKTLYKDRMNLDLFIQCLELKSTINDLNQAIDLSNARLQYRFDLETTDSTETNPENTAIVVEYSLDDVTNQPVQNNSDFISGDLTGKDFYLRYTLSTTDTNVTPSIGIQ